MDVEDAIEVGLGLQRVEPAFARPDPGVHLGEGIRHLGTIERWLAQPALAVTTDPGALRQRDQAFERLHRPRASDTEVAAEQVRIGALVVCIPQDFLERGQVPVDVVEDGEHRGLGCHT